MGSGVVWGAADYLTDSLTAESDWVGGRLSTWTCPLGWPVQGVYRDVSKADHVLSVSRSPDGGVMATGDAYGKVNLFRCVSQAIR